MSDAEVGTRRGALGGGRLSRGDLSVLASIVVVLAAWTAAASLVPSYIFPTPVELLASIRAVFVGGEFSPAVNYGYTLLRVAVASALCLGVGVAVGILMGMNARVKEYLYVFVLATFAFPSVIWAFLAVLWFGLTTLLVPVFAVFMIVAPYVAIIVEEGMRELDQDLVEMADSFGADGDLRWRQVYLPHLYPQIFASTRLTITLAWKITIVAEIFGTRNGVGQVVAFFFESQRVDMILAWAVPMMLLMYLIEQLLQRIETARFSWREGTDVAPA